MKPILQTAFTVSFVALFVLAGGDYAFARDFTGSVNSIGSDIKNIVMVLGPVMLMVAGAVFYFSRQQGMSMLVSAAIGTVIFAASSSIFMMLYRAFN